MALPLDMDSPIKPTDYPPPPEMEPPIGQSMSLTSAGRWTMGTRMLCEELTSAPPADAITTWNDGFATYCLRPNPEPITNFLPPPGDPLAGRFRNVGRDSAGYAIGPNTICKIRSWSPPCPIEAESIAFVKKNAPSVPVPNVYYSWVDEPWHRVFMLMQRAPGQLLDDAWLKFTPKQKQQVANEIASHVATLAELTSPRLESAGGHGIRGPSLLSYTPDRSPFLPNWVPDVHPTFTVEEFIAYMHGLSGLQSPDFGDKFHFYHDDLGPENILVVDPVPAENESIKGPLVTTIIDWETAAFYPRWWLSTKFLVCFNTALDWKKHGDVSAWARRVSKAVQKKGFETVCDWWFEHEKPVNEKEEKARAPVWEEKRRKIREKKRKENAEAEKRH